MEMTSQLPYLFGAFTVIWVGIFGFLYRISSRQKELQREIAALNEVLNREEKVAETAHAPRVTGEEVIHTI